MARSVSAGLALPDVFSWVALGPDHAYVSGHSSGVAAIAIDEGVIVAVGWPGQWAAEFVRDDDKGIRIRAGQELTHFKLLPGEEVRSPLVVLHFWQGRDWIEAQNLWRRWMMA